tara:strand:- start:3920 stop:4135 length:216 start_codon:yes stop_codon:yes gene_type:complete
MSKMSKKKVNKKEEVMEDVVATVDDYIQELSKAQNIINQLVTELNNHKALCVQYENTINALTGRLLEGRSQ